MAVVWNILVNAAPLVLADAVEAGALKVVHWMKAHWTHQRGRAEQGASQRQLAAAVGDRLLLNELMFAQHARLSPPPLRQV